MPKDKKSAEKILVWDINTGRKNFGNRNWIEKKRDSIGTEIQI